MAGYAELVSVGQQAYVGFGGYMLFALAMFGGVDPLVAVALAGVFGAIIAAPVALLVFRLHGAYFAIGTWVVVEIFRLVFSQLSALGGGSGTSLPVGVVRSIAFGRDLRDWLIHWAAPALGIGATIGIYASLRSWRGLALMAIRDNENASQSLGVDIWRTKFVVYHLVAAATSMVGATIFLQKLRISPDAAFSVNDWTAFVIFITVIGGIGTIEGPIIGTLIFFLLRELLADLGAVYLIILGLVAVLAMLTAPGGLWGLVADRLNLSFFLVGCRLRFGGEG